MVNNIILASELDDIFDDDDIIEIENDINKEDNTIFYYEGIFKYDVGYFCLDSSYTFSINFPLKSERNLINTTNDCNMDVDKLYRVTFYNTINNKKVFSIDMYITKKGCISENNYRFIYYRFDCCGVLNTNDNNVNLPSPILEMLNGIKMYMIIEER